MPRTLDYSGWLSLRSDGQADDVLFIDSNERPFAEILAEDFSGENVTVRYWVSKKECVKDEAEISIAKTILGAAVGEFGHAYSELTGYLWTDEAMQVGGHDLLAELKSFHGSYLNLEVIVHCPPERKWRK